MLQLASLDEELSSVPKATLRGRVTSLRGPIIVANLPAAALGHLCLIERQSGPPIRAEIVSFELDKVFLAPFDSIQGIGPGAPVKCLGRSLQIPVSEKLIGQVVNALGEVISPRIQSAPSQISPVRNCALESSPPEPLSRPVIKDQLWTGISSIDALCSLGYGQRIGLFASAGLGKSTLLGMLARQAKVDLTVVALVGERGREVNEFLEDALGPNGLSSAIVVVSTSDESPIRRAMAPKTATAIAEYFRDQGKRVLLLVDSLTRSARAIREVGLSIGELPVRQGYTASVYTEIPKLLERAGTSPRGSITAIYTVLTAGDSEPDPLGDEVKSILDGHIILSERVARSGIRPAINIPASISRVMSKIRSPQDLEDSGRISQALARLQRDRDILLFGGSPDPELKRALEIEPEIRNFIIQSPQQFRTAEHSSRRLKTIADGLRHSY